MSNDEKPMMPAIPASHRPFAPREKWTGPTEYGSAIVRDLRKRMAEFRDKVPDRSWAPIVLERAARGEPICLHVQEIAAEVLGRGRHREPGEDDE